MLSLYALIGQTKVKQVTSLVQGRFAGNSTASVPVIFSPFYFRFGVASLSPNFQFCFRRLSAPGVCGQLGFLPWHGEKNGAGEIHQTVA